MIDQNTVHALVDLADRMRASAIAPYSNFYVGAALLTEDGQMVGGCNIESASYGLTMCAERVALYSALAAGHRKIVLIVLTTNSGSFPCGACRQMLYEFCIQAHLIVRQGDQTIATLPIQNLLPYAFGSSDLEKSKKETDGGL